MWLYPFLLVVVTLKHCALLFLEIYSNNVGLVFNGGAGAGYSLTGYGYGCFTVDYGVHKFIQNMNGNFLKTRLLSVDSAAVMSMQDITTSCVNVLTVRPLNSLLFYGVSSTPWVI